MLKLGIIGEPVAHSRSKLIHEFWLKQYGVAGRYTRLPTPREADIGAVFARLRDAGWRGVNVTIPHKTNAYRAADSHSAMAAKLHAANIIDFADGRIFADNSDGAGFLASLDAMVSREIWCDAPVLVLGAGGAARAIIAALAQVKRGAGAGAGEIRLANRTRANAESLVPLASPVGVKIYDWAARCDALDGCRLLVNTTSIGMGAGAGDTTCPIELDMMESGVVLDIVYAPLITPLLAAARVRGLLAVDGLGMLLHQAVPAFARWTGIVPQVDDALRRYIEADL